MCKLDKLNVVAVIVVMGMAARRLLPFILLAHGCFCSGIRWLRCKDKDRPGGGRNKVWSENEQLVVGRSGSCLLPYYYFVIEFEGSTFFSLSK